MPRKGVRDLAKEHHWRDLLKAWQASELNGAEFCRRHNVKYAQFKDWQKIIRRRDAEKLASAKGKRGLSKGKLGKNPAAASLESGATSRRVAFVAATLTATQHVAPELGTADGISIVLRCGTMLRIPAGCRPDFVSSVVAALENR